jgi:IS30 family transposase
VATGHWDKKTSDAPERLRRQWRADRALRPAMRSPGRPDPSRAVQRQFWRLIATGITSAEAAITVGVSVPVGMRWFRHAGGMPPISLAEPSGRYLSFEEREEIAILNAQDRGVREIARTIGRDPATISRELRRNAATRGGKPEYRATVAQWKAQQAAKRPKTAKLVENQRLRDYVQDRLAGNVRRPDGTVVPGPMPPAWKGLNKPHRADRRWSLAWSPEQIAQRLKIEFPDDESMRISHEAIYQSLFIEGRGALKRELVTCLRTGRALRQPRARSQNKPGGHVTADVVLSERPADAEDRAVPGHWEGDLIIGTGRSAIGTLVERSSRATLLVHLPRMEGWGEKPYVKNGPSLGGYGAIAMNAALTASMTKLPEQLRKTLTWDRGKELSGHALFTIETGTKVFFADPHSPWQRPSNENTNGLLRQYFPKGTDLSRWSAEDLEAVAHTLNNRPRKVLKWKTPAEVFEEQLQSLHQAGVATTG